jgi:hypothetical protein
MNYTIFAYHNPGISPISPVVSKQKRLLASDAIFLFPEESIDLIIKKIDRIDILIERWQYPYTIKVFYLGDMDQQYRMIIGNMYPQIDFRLLPISQALK